MRDGFTEGSPVRVICNPASGGGAYEPASLRAVLGGLEPDWVVTEALGNPSGFVLSDLGHFEKGPPFLTPQAGINHYWNRLPTLSPTLKEKGLEEGITPERRRRYHRLTKADDTVAVPSGRRPAT